MFEPIRGGTRGGQAEFKWSDVSADKDRENYLGHSINAPTGRWQKNKDVHWYNRELNQAEDERLAEIKRIKELEADALAVALGFEPAKKSNAGATAAATSPTDPTPNTQTNVLPPGETDAQRALEKEGKHRRKAERKEEKRARKEEKKKKRRLERESYNTQRYPNEDDRGHGRGRPLSLSPSRSRSWSRTPPPPSARRHSASPRRRVWSPRRRSQSMSRSPPRRRLGSYRDTFQHTLTSARRRPSRSRSRSLEGSRSRTPPRRGYEPIRGRRDSYPDGERYGRDRPSMDPPPAARYDRR